MREFLHAFKVLDVQRNDNWIDIILVDKCRNANRREWRFSFDTDDHHYYATLYRAPDDEGPFDHSVDLPKTMVKKLWYLAAPHIALRRLKGEF
jgi:hypothetical protein